MEGSPAENVNFSCSQLCIVLIYILILLKKSSYEYGLVRALQHGNVSLHPFSICNLGLMLNKFRKSMTHSNYQRPSSSFVVFSSRFFLLVGLWVCVHCMTALLSAAKELALIRIWRVFGKF